MDLPLYFRIAFCVPAFLWAAYYFHRATRVGRYVAIALIVIVVYGFVIEYFDIRSSHSYDYATMLVMLGERPYWVPLSICVSWAAVFFVVTSLSDRLKLPWYQRPLMDGMLATAIDLVGDPVFSNSRYVSSLVRSCTDAGSPVFGGIGVWTWCVPADDRALWFTVPFGNFVGWFLVIAVFSFLFRLGANKLGAIRRPALVQLGMIIGFAALSAVGVELLLWAFTQIPYNLQGVVFAALMLAPLVLVAAQRRRLDFRNRFDLGIVLMPLVGNISGVLIFFQRGIDRSEWPAWAIVYVLTAVVVTVIVLLPFLGRLLRPSVAPEPVVTR